MKRKLYNLCTLASVLLLAGSIWWWSHSRQHTDQVTLHGVGGTSVQLTGSDGKLMLTKANTGGGKSGGQLSWNSSHGNGKLAAASFAYSSQSHGMTLVLPVWALMFAFAACPGIWVWSKMKRKGGKKPAAAH
jgi:hypothetical protein